MDAIDTIKYKGYDIDILQDCDPGSPREWDNVGTMVCFHRRYNLGDKHDFSDPEALLEYIERPDVIFLPLYLYDHSGVSISTSSFIGRAHHAEWDSGMVGFIVVTREKGLQETARKRLTQAAREHIYRLLQGEVEVYDQYLRGDVYGYEVLSQDREYLDSCWGFYGSDHEKSGLLDYARNAIEYEIKKRAEEAVRDELAATYLR